MKIQNVTDASFRKYGKIITEYSFEKILKEMEHTPLPKDVVYVPSVEELEVLPEAAEICKKDSADCLSRLDTVMETTIN